MPTHLPAPARITAAGNKPKLIDEYVGRVNSQTAALSVAHMRSQRFVGPTHPRRACSSSREREDRVPHVHFLTRSVLPRNLPRLTA